MCPAAFSPFVEPGPVLRPLPVELIRGLKELLNFREGDVLPAKSQAVKTADGVAEAALGVPPSTQTIITAPGLSWLLSAPLPCYADPALPGKGGERCRRRKRKGNRKRRWTG